MTKPTPAATAPPAAGAELLGRLKELTAAHKLKGQVRVTRSGCLDYCAKGLRAGGLFRGLAGPGNLVYPCDARATPMRCSKATSCVASELTRLVEPDKNKE